MRATFAVGFYCRESKKNRSGLAPIEVSLSLNGERSFIQLPVKERPEIFNRKRRPAYLEELLEQWRVKVMETQTAILRASEPLTVRNIKEYLRTGGVKSYTLSQLRKDFMKYVSERWTNNEVSYEQYRKYERETEYIVKHYGDIEVNDISQGETDRLAMYVKKNYKPATSRGVWMRMKGMFVWGVRNRKITYNPLDGIKFKAPKTEVKTITLEELRRIESKDFGNERLQKVADAFLFSCGSGLAYIDLVNLKPEDIVERDGCLCIFKQRQKTKVEYYSVLTPVAERIYRKYNGDLSQLKISNQKLNVYLKAVQDICCITSVPSLHQHLGRHFYATYLLSEGLPITTVSKCLGHTNIKTSLHYSKVLEATVLNEFKKIQTGGN